MKVAIASCGNLPDWEVDDQALYDALARSGVAFDIVPWDQYGVDWGHYDACLIRTTWDYMERRAEFVEWAQRVASMTMLLNDAGVVAWNTDKTYLRLLESRGTPIADTVWLQAGTSVDVGEILREKAWERGFLKPVVGASARETLRFGIDELEDAQVLLSRLLPNESFMLQPYFEDVETEGEISAIYFDGQLSHAVQKIPVAGDYRVQDDYGASDFPVQLSDTLESLAEGALEHGRQALGMEAPFLYARVDFIPVGDGRHVVNELELVEPSLFLRHSANAAGLLVEALLRRLKYPERKS